MLGHRHAGSRSISVLSIASQQSSLSMTSETAFQVEEKAAVDPSISEKEIRKIIHEGGVVSEAINDTPVPIHDVDSSMEPGVAGWLDLVGVSGSS